MEEWTTDFKTTKEKQLQAGNTENKKKILVVECSARASPAIHKTTKELVHRIISLKTKNAFM